MPLDEEICYVALTERNPDYEGVFYVGVRNHRRVLPAAQANGANPFAIVIPCHRVINADGGLCGYGGGLPRKRWLLDHERRWAAATG